MTLAQVSQMPQMTSTMSGWLVPITLGIVRKEQNGFTIREFVEEVSFKGVWQPLEMSRLQIKEDGQRHWNWYWLHTPMDLKIKIDDVVMFQGQQYRVMSDKNYSLNGFYEYELIEDYTGAGPISEGAGNGN
jgi:hypothetical protein